MSSQISARHVLHNAEAVNRQQGHANLGFLSHDHGFMPSTPPLRHLPTSHRAWDEVASELPTLYRTLRLRQTFEALPLLSAAEESLPDAYLLRASALLSIFAHACARAESATPTALPDAITIPWQTVTKRLGRRAPVLSYIDLIVYNWQLLEPTDAGPLRPELVRLANLRLLLPTVGNREEEIFYLTQTEMLAQSTPIVRACVRAQEAALQDDPAVLKRELVTITDTLYAITHGSFMQINPNPRSATYVDPVIWAKTVAPFAVPIHAGVQGPSGTSSPIFHLLDLFFKRSTYDSILGQESLHLRGWYPPHWQAFLAAVDRVSVQEYVTAKADRELTGLYQEALNAYAGEDGFLGRHRLKVYGYLELAFKVGRSVTIGGFSGLFQDRTWDEVDDALDAARLEREQRGFPGWHTVASLPAEAAETARSVGAHERHVHTLRLDVTDAGIRYHPGDRCCVLPENEPPLVEKTLAALQATGTETVLLNQRWRHSLAIRPGHEQSNHLSLRDLLRFGQIRPVTRAVATLLYQVTANVTLAQILASRAEDQWELWDLLLLLSDDGFDPTVLWQAHPADRESICWIIPPERYRMYSIASAAVTKFDIGCGDNIGCGDKEMGQQELHLLVGQLHYQTGASPHSRPAQRRGTGSSFVARVAQNPQPQTLAVKLVRPPRFHLPDDPTQPLLLFAGGTGIAPFRGFIHARTAQPGAAPVWLFYAARTHTHFPVDAEVARAMAAGQLHLYTAFSQADVQLVLAADRASIEAVPGQRQRIDDLILQAETSTVLWQLLHQQASIYICGQAGFAHTLLAALKTLLARKVSGTQEERMASAQQQLYQLVAEERLHQEIYTTYQRAQPQLQREINISELVLHNDERHGYWIALEGRVYDLNEFLHMHPGGAKILRGYTGMDGTPAYQKVLHHARPEVHAQLALYEIGWIRRLEFGTVGGVALAEDRPRHVKLSEAYQQYVRFLYLVVEMENALQNDYTIGEGRLTRDQTAETPAAYQWQLVAEVHERFLITYLHELMGPPSISLWSILVGLSAPGEDVRWLEWEFAALRQRHDVQHLANHAKAMVQLASGDQSSTPAQLATLLGQLEEVDKQLLRELKLLLCQGLRLLEVHEAATLDRAGPALIAPFQQMPALIGDYFSQLTHLVE